jgi:hypothetical protein
VAVEIGSKNFGEGIEIMNGLFWLPAFKIFPGWK